jgi:hypothetical protein
MAKPRKFEIAEVPERLRVQVLDQVLGKNSLSSSWMAVKPKDSGGVILGPFFEDRILCDPFTSTLVRRWSFM